MLDIKYIRENKEAIKKAAKNKNIDFDVDELINIDEKRRGELVKIEQLRSRRNKLAEAGKKGKPTAEQVKQGRKLKEQIAELEKRLALTKEEYLNLMVKVPTVPSPDTPLGKDADDNVEIFRNKDLPAFAFKPKTHVELASALDLIDFDRGAKVAGYRGYYLKNEASLLVMALMMHALNKMVIKGYTPMITPTLVKEFALFGSGYFKGLKYDGAVDEIYQVATSDKEADGGVSEDKKFLVGTAEPSLLAYYAGEILKEDDLPIRLCGFSPCYRSEIGSYGKDSKGLYRVHEFFKIEQVVIAKADILESNKLQEEMISITKEIHEELGLTYHLLQLCTGDMSPGKYRAIDIETWLPGSGRWAETGSASNFLDWQARRLNVRYADKNGDKKYVYMLNNTALPSPRPLIAIMENYQRSDGSIVIPEILRKFMPGEIKTVKKDKC